MLYFFAFTSVLVIGGLDIIVIQVSAEQKDFDSF